MNAHKVHNDMHVGVAGGLMAAHAAGGPAGLIGMFLLICIVCPIVVGAVALWQMRETLVPILFYGALVAGFGFLYVRVLRPGLPRTWSRACVVAFLALSAIVAECQASCVSRAAAAVTGIDPAETLGHSTGIAVGPSGERGLGKRQREAANQREEAQCRVWQAEGSLASGTPRAVARSGMCQDWLGREHLVKACERYDAFIGPSQSYEAFYCNRRVPEQQVAKKR